MGLPVQRIYNELRNFWYQCLAYCSYQQPKECDNPFLRFVVYRWIYASFFLVKIITDLVGIYYDAAEAVWCKKSGEQNLDFKDDLPFNNTKCGRCGGKKCNFFIFVLHLPRGGKCNIFIVKLPFYLPHLPHFHKNHLKSMLFSWHKYHVNILKVWYLRVKSMAFLN